MGLVIYYMEHKKGFLYFVSDDFFQKANDPFLKKEHETTKRPHYFAYKDPSTPLVWIIPCSSQIAKYEKIISDKQAAGKPTDIIKIVKIQDRKEALLFQDMFPILPKYLLDQYIRGQQPVYIADPNTIYSLEKNAKKVIGLLRRGIKFTPTQPNALRIEKLMIAEIALEQKGDPAQAVSAVGKTPQNMKDRMAAAVDEAKKRNDNTLPAPKRPKDLEK